MPTDHRTLDMDEQLRAFAVALEAQTAEPIRPGARPIVDDRVAHVVVEPSGAPSRPDRRRWVLVAAAAVILAVGLVVGLAVIGDDTAPSDTPTSAPPVSAPPTTPASDDNDRPPSPVDAAVVEEYFGAYNADDTDRVLAMLAPDAVVSETYGGMRPDPDNDPMSAADFEPSIAWNHAQGEELTEPDCHVAEEQPVTGVRLDCTYTTRDALVQALDATAVPTRTLITIVDGQITELHHSYGSPDFAFYGQQFDAWMEENHPDVDGALCCAGDTRDESVARGELRAQWAQQWASALAAADDASAGPAPEPAMTVPALAAPVDGETQQSVVGNITWTRVDGDRATLPSEVGFELDDVFYGDGLPSDPDDPQPNLFLSPDGVVWTAWDDAPTDADDLTVAAGTIWATFGARETQPSLSRWDGEGYVPVELPGQDAVPGDALVAGSAAIRIAAEFENKIIVERTESLRVPWDELLSIEPPLTASEEGGEWSGTFRVRALECDEHGGCTWSDELPPPTWNIRPEVVEGTPTRVDLYDDDTGELITTVVPPDDGRPIDDVVFSIGAENVAGRRVDFLVMDGDGSNVRRADWTLSENPDTYTEFAELDGRLFALTNAGHHAGKNLRLWVTDDLDSWEELPVPGGIDQDGYSFLSSDASTMILTTSAEGSLATDHTSWITTDGISWTARESAIAGSATQAPASTNFGWVDFHDARFDQLTGEADPAPTIAISSDAATWQMLPIPIPVAIADLGLNWADASFDGDSSRFWQWVASAHGDTIFISLYSEGPDRPAELWVGRVSTP